MSSRHKTETAEQFIGNSRVTNAETSLETCNRFKMSY